MGRLRSWWTDQCIRVRVWVDVLLQEVGRR